METLFFKSVPGFFRVSDVERKNLTAEDKKSMVNSKKSRVKCKGRNLKVCRFLIVLENDV